MNRFFDKVHKTDSCWNWTASTRNGYGAFKINGKVEGAHRVSWVLNNGEIPEGLFVCHKCDNPRCVNPEHLFLGTASDNMKDCYNKGRLIIPIKGNFKKGHIPFNRSLSFEQIIHIKNAIKNRTGSLKLLSATIDVSYQLLRDINCGRVYKN